jgi:hypothetical protein
VTASRELQQEIRVWQEAKLQKYFIDEPLALLNDAIEKKRKSSAIRAEDLASIGKKQTPNKKESARALARTAP